MTRASIGGVAVVAVCAALLACPAMAGDAGVRVVPLASLGSKEAALAVVSSAVAAGERALLVPVALFSEPPAGVADIIAAARQQSMRVVAAVDVTLAAGGDELPASRDHVIYAHPEWLMVPRELAHDLARLDPRSPDYAGRLARWTRANAAQVGGLYLSPIHRDAAAFMAGAVQKLVQRFQFDGVQFETARYPSAEFDYSRLAIDAMRRDVRPTLSADERRRMDDVETVDVLAYPEEFPDLWRRFRQTQLTALVVRLRTAVKAVRPDVVVSAAVAADPATALTRYFQDWATWLDNRFVDSVAGDRDDVSAGTTPTPDEGAGPADP